MKVSVIIGQFPVTLNIYENLNNIYEILKEANEDDLVILPEGALSGYKDDISFVKHIDLEKLNISIKQLKKEVSAKKIHLIFGSCIKENSSWYNAAICFSYSSPDFIYKKVNLATHERGHFSTGNQLSIYSINIGENHLKVGIQLCREIRYPEQWRWLALNGADIFVYLTNAIEGKGLSIWRSHLISRVAENQRFLISSNNAHKDQHCPTMIISPMGEVIEEIVSKELVIIKKVIDTSEISNWYLSQSREDLIKLMKVK